MSYNVNSRAYRLQGTPTVNGDPYVDVPGFGYERDYEDPANVIRFRQGRLPRKKTEKKRKSFLQRPSDLVYLDPWGIRAAPGEVNDPEILKHVPKYDMSSFTGPLTTADMSARRHFEDLAIRPDRLEALEVQEELARHSLRFRSSRAHMAPLARDSAARGMAWMEMYDPVFRAEHPVPFSYQGQRVGRTYDEPDITQPWVYQRPLGTLPPVRVVEQRPSSPVPLRLDL